MLFLGLPAAAIFVGMIWFAAPRLIEVQPADGSADAPVGSVLVLRFSRSMQTSEVESRITIEPDTGGEFFWQGTVLTYTPDDPWPAGTEVSVRLEPGARPAGFPPLRLRFGKEWRFTIRQPRLAFLTPASGPANILMRDLAAGTDAFLTDFDSGVDDFCLGPDGRVIFISAIHPDGGSDIYRLNLAPPLGLSAAEIQAMDSAANPSIIVGCAPAICRSPALSPNGEFLAYERVEPPQVGREDRPQVWIQPLNGQGGAHPVGDPSDSLSMPVWSPEGRLTVFSSNNEAFIVFDASGVEQARFPNETGQPGDWQSGGEAFIAPEIIFTDANISPALQLERLADSHLMLYRFPEGEPADLTGVEGIEDISPRVSPDGRSLAFARKFLDARRWTPGRQLWLMDLVTRAARSLTDDRDYTHYDFAWSPDGRRLAFVRFNQSLLTEPPEIWVLDLYSGERSRVFQGGYSPVWIP